MSAPNILFSFLPSFFVSQIFRTPKVPQTDLSGKTVIVTGANVGLGKEAARHFVRMGAAKVILGCRSVDKGEAAKRDIETTTKRSGVIEVWPVDLANYQSIKDFATRANGLDRLDILLENAGINSQKFSLLAGNESNITINVISTFLLGLLIIPKLRESGHKFNFTPTLTIVTSELHFTVPLKESKQPSIFDTLNDEKKANMGERYPLSKLLEIFALREIAKEHPVKQLGVSLNTVNPGMCQSELVREFANPAIRTVLSVLGRKTEVGSRTLVDAAASHGAESHGQYISDQKIATVAPLIKGKEGPELQRRIWHELAEKLEQIQPGILKNLDG